MIETEGDGSIRYLTDALPRYGIRPESVLHVGAHVGEEVPMYWDLGFLNIALVEPGLIAGQILRDTYGNTSGVQLFTTYPITGDERCPLMCRTTDGRTLGESWIESDGPTPDSYASVLLRDVQAWCNATPNVLVVDTQGTELDVLRQGDFAHVDLIVVETCDEGTPGPAADFGKVNSFLVSHGFRCVERWRHGKHVYSDTVFVKGKFL